MPPSLDDLLPLATPRLVLREFRETDLADLHAYAADPEVARFMAWGPNTPDQTWAFLDRALSAQSQWPRLDLGLAMEHAADARVIGSINLHLRDAEGVMELGYALARPYWRRGLATEAARAMADLAFRLGVHRLYATCDVRNEGSWRVMQAIGMTREGLLRADRKIKGAWRDTLVYAALREEWA